MQRGLLTKNQYGILYALLALAGLAVLVVALSADRLGLGGGGPQIGVNQFYLAFSGLVVFVSGVVPFVRSRGRLLGVWFLLALGAFAIALASDLFVLLGNIPGLGDIAGTRSKLVLLLSVAFGFVMIHSGAWEQNGLHILEDARKNLKGSAATVGKFFGVAFQLGLIIVVFREFELGNVVFYDSILQLVFYGFALHYLLPQEHRLQFFLFLSLAAFFGVLGVSNGAWLIGVGLGLLGLSHLPIKFSYRVLLILAVTVFLAVSRAGLIEIPFPVAVWPILGSIFMFRLVIYLYDLKHSKKPADFWSALSYFFLLPNVVFPFFPVVDYSTFKRTYNNDEQHRIYQKGVDWIWRGVVQLLFYRVIYYYVAISPEDVKTAAELVRYTIANFMFYLRVSGEFHIIIGLLHLFGFNLPVTNDRYLLSSSFTDLWRRVNIYWKDFMQKIFYYPSYFWLTKRKITGNTALVLTTILVFAVTWVLHSYQWFWLRGSFLFAAYDILFWSILTVFMIRNTLKEAKKTKTHTLAGQQLGFREIVKRAVGNTATISLLFFLWTLWTSPSIDLWLSLWSVAASLQGVLTLALAFLAGVVVFTGVNWIYRETLTGGAAKPAQQQDNFPRVFVLNSVAIILVFLMGNASIYNRFGSASQFFADLTSSRLNDVDAKLLQRGYYEDLMGLNRFNTELWDIYSKRPTNWPLLQDTSAARVSEDEILVIQLNPSVQINFHGAPFSTNHWGFRDQDYALSAAPGTYRIAIIGPSFVMGSGVADDAVFEAILEEKLNQDFGGKKFDRYEILNFGMAGYAGLQELYLLEQRVMDFQPNSIIWVGHDLEQSSLVRYIANRLSLRIEIPFDFVNDVAVQAGVQLGMSEGEIAQLLAPFGRELVSRTYDRVIEYSQEKGFTPIWIYLPVFVESNSEEIRGALIQQAQDAGFITFNLSPIYDGYDLQTLYVAEWDRHPNREGNLLIAGGIYSALLNNPVTAEALGLVK